MDTKDRVRAIGTLVYISVVISYPMQLHVLLLMVWGERGEEDSIRWLFDKKKITSQVGIKSYFMVVVMQLRISLCCMHKLRRQSTVGI